MDRSFQRYRSLFLSLPFAFLLGTLPACGDLGPEENQPPDVSIEAPADGAGVTEGESLTLQGSATDPEDGPVPDHRLIWTSDVGGQLGTGRSVTVPELEVAEHHISLRATDSEGASDETSVAVVVLPAGNVSIEVDVPSDQDAKTGIDLGETRLIPFRTVVRPPEGEPVDVSRHTVWRSTDPQVATVNDEGVLEIVDDGMVGVVGDLPDGRGVVAAVTPILSDREGAGRPDEPAAAGLATQSGESDTWTNDQNLLDAFEQLCSVLANYGLGTSFLWEALNETDFHREGENAGGVPAGDGSTGGGTVPSGDAVRVQFLDESGDEMATTQSTVAPGATWVSETSEASEKTGASAGTGDLIVVPLAGVQRMHVILSKGSADDLTAGQVWDENDSARLSEAARLAVHELLHASIHWTALSNAEEIAAGPVPEAEEALVTSTEALVTKVVELQRTSEAGAADQICTEITDLHEEVRRADGGSTLLGHLNLEDENGDGTPDLVDQSCS